MNKVCVYQDFESLPTIYKAIFADTSATPDIFQSLPWFRNLASTGLPPNTSLRIYGIAPEEEQGKPLLILPLCHQTSAQKRFSSRNLTALSTYYTSLFSPIIGKSHTLPASSLEENLQVLIQAIATERPRWDTIDLHPLEADSQILNGLVNTFRKNGMAVQRYFCFGNWYLKVDGRTFHEYCSALPSKLRNTLERKSKQLENANRLRIRIFSSIDELDVGIQAYEKIYNASWKTPETYPAFIPGLMHTCAAQGWLRLGIAYIDEQPAAAQIWIVYNKVASIYKLAYDEQFASFSIGTILTARLMQQVIDVDKVREVDYLTGDDDYKKDWMSDRRERTGLIAFNLYTLRGFFAACKNVGGHAVKKIIRFNAST
ncbi:MAG: GNAT family N-acetyltransferase [Burkholderiaceae bacterium]